MGRKQPGRLPDRAAADPAASFDNRRAGWSVAVEARTVDTGRKGSGPRGADDRDGRRSSPVVALILGLVAVLAALALPFAPVSVNQPQVSWPTDPAAPVSTMLMLSAYRPLALDASVSCRAARAAAAGPDATVLATTRPDSPAGVASGLLVSAGDDVLSVTSRGAVLAREPIGSAPCLFRLFGEGDSVVVSRDGRELGRGPMPDVDALVTSAKAIPGSTATDLSVRLTVDDRFSSTPAPAKVALLAVLVVAVCGSIAVLALDGRRRWRRRPAARVRRPGAVRATVVCADAAVVVALGVWLFLAPLTNDDGYYAAMAANSDAAGYVGNYYQLSNQGFTPFTWVYQALAGWQQLAGPAPVVQRIPALLCGLLTWACVRRLAATAGRWPSVTRASPGPGAPVLVLAVAFLAWWMPFDMGLRPETAVALAVVASLLCLVRAAARESLLLVGAAVGIGSVGLVAAPSGLVVLAPLIAGAPLVWPLLRGADARSAGAADGDGGRLGTAGRILCTLAPGAAGAVAACGDGSWGDFVRAQQLLTDAQAPEGFYTEYRRWLSLFESGSSTYAHRAAVLVTVLALVGLLVLWVASRVRGRRLPTGLLLSGTTTALAFVLLSPTPSKPWMHFGTIAGVGGLFLGLLLVHGPAEVRELAAGRRVPRVAVAGAVAAVVATLAVAGHGLTTWWLNSWSPRLPHAGTPPQISIFRFDQPVWWLLAIVVVATVGGALAPRRFAGWRPYSTLVALAAIVTVFLAGTVTYMVGTFGLEAARTLTTWSFPAQNVRDPLARECGAGSQVGATDPVGSPLEPATGVPGPPAGSGFTVDPARPRPPAPGATVWGSRAVDPDASNVPVDAGDAGAEPATGTVTTPWFTLPPTGPDRAVTASVSGLTGAGNALTAEYGRAYPGGVDTLGTRNADAGPDGGSPAWRPIVVASGAAPPPAGADVVRLVAVDGRSDAEGWIAFTVPRVSRFVALAGLVPTGTATALSWNAALLFPCTRQPRIGDGITEPPGWAVGYTDGPLQILREVGWQASRGDAFGQTARQAGITQLTARLKDAPGIRRVQVYRLEQPFAPAAYELTPGRRTVPGWTP